MLGVPRAAWKAAVRADFDIRAFSLAWVDAFDVFGKRAIAALGVRDYYVEACDEKNFKKHFFVVVFLINFLKIKIVIKLFIFVILYSFLD